MTLLVDNIAEAETPVTVTASGVVGESICLGCANEKSGPGPCTNCAWRDGAQPDSSLYLRPGTILRGQYVVGRVLGHGGFGITYIGRDNQLKLRVAIKEYLPSALAAREPASGRVSPFSGHAREHFQFGLRKYKEEARALARFNEHPGIVSVLNFLEENGTGYIIMPYLDGLTLKDYLATRGGKLEPGDAVSILIPVMDSLREIHAAAILHRDISPDNVFVTSSSQVKLLDFGAARHATGERSQNLSVILKPGYAPEEQYRSNGKQGPWTDIYALAATLYQAITGQTPPESPDRLERDDIRTPSQLGIRIPAEAESALMKALSVRAPDRFQDVASFQSAIAPALAGTIDLRQFNQQNDKSAGARRGKNGSWIAITSILAMAALALGIGWGTASNHAREMLSRAIQDLHAAERESKRLEHELDQEKQARASLVRNHPDRQASIEGIKFRNELNGIPLGSYSDVFFNKAIRYIHIYAKVDNNWLYINDLSGQLEIRLLKPDGTAKHVFTESINTSDSCAVEESWGDSQGEEYAAGIYTVEFWWAGKKIRETTFAVWGY